MEQLQKNISNFTDEELLHQYENFKEDYTNAALNLLSEEIKRRSISVEQLPKKSSEQNVYKFQDEKDFLPLQHSFNKKDIEIIVAIFKGNKIPFIIDFSSIVGEIEDDNYFSLKIFHEKEKDANECINEHFEVEENHYRLKKLSIVEQLKSFSFTQLQIDEKEAKENVEVDFSDIEKRTIIEAGNLILEKTATIENDLERVIFYYDVIEPLISSLEKRSSNEYSKTELLTVLELMQISTEFNSLPLAMEPCIEALISFFEEATS